MNNSSIWHPYWLSFPKKFEYDKLDREVIEYIISCYHKYEGGFGNYTTEKTSFISPTVKALICLNLFKEMTIIKRTDIYFFIMSCQNSDAGFAITVSKNDLYPSALESTFYSIIGLKLIGYLPRLKLQKPKIVNWVLSHYNVDGGFHGEGSVISNEYYTFLAVTSLNILNTLDRIDSELTINYLINRQTNKNPEVKLTTSRLQSLYFLLGLEKLTEGLNIRISTSRLVRLQNKNGGFRKKKIELVYRSDMLSTFQAILGLKIINKIDRIKVRKVIDWILSCQNNDGGFGSKTNSDSSLSNTFYAIVSLFYLNRL